MPDAKTGGFSAETFFEGLGTLLKVGGGLNSANKAADSLDKSAAAYREAGDNALIIAGKNAEAYRKLGDNALLVADFNARQYEQRADQFIKQRGDLSRKGVAEENDLRLNTAQLIGSQRAGYAASGVIINRGTPAAMQIGTARQGEVDALRIRDNYVSLIKDNEFEEGQARGQASLIRMQGEHERDAAYNTADIYNTEGGFAKSAAYNNAAAMDREGDNMENASYVDALGNIISSPTAQKWLIDTFKGTIGGGGGGTPTGTPGGTGTPSPTWASKYVPTAGEFAAGFAGGYAGQYLGEKITGNEKTANWGATIGGYIGSITPLGPLGAAIGAAIGGFIDSAFGSSYSHNAGFLLHDVPGAPADRKFSIEPFASGIQPVGFVRRQSKADAEQVIEPFRALDKVIVDAGKEFGKTITGEFVRGTDEKGDAANDGVFIGSASEAGKKGKSVAAHMDQYGTQLLQSLQGQVSEEGFARIMAAPDMEAKIKTMREVLAAEASA